MVIRDWEIKDSLSVAIAVMVAHGIMTEQEFEQLDKKNFHNELCGLLFGKLDELNELNQ